MKIVKIIGRIIGGILLSPFFLVGFLMFALPTFIIEGKWENPWRWEMRAEKEAQELTRIIEKYFAGNPTQFKWTPSQLAKQILKADYHKCENCTYKMVALARNE